MKIGIVGAGIMGRLLAWQLTQQGHDISLFDKSAINASSTNSPAAAFTAAGMITPISEIESCEKQVVALGLEGLALWPSIVEKLEQDVDYHQTGSIVLAHQADRVEYANFERYLRSNTLYQSKAEYINAAQLQTLEPGCSAVFQKGIYIQNESWLSPLTLLHVLAEKLIFSGAKFFEHMEIIRTEAHTISSGSITGDTQHWEFDWVFDCRGLGGKQHFPNLRGVRGEVIWLHAPEVKIKHLVRLLHPRYRIYIVPRKNHHFVIGATQIESDFNGPITVRSTLELLSAAYSVHSGFAEANIIETRVNCRPALPNNLPNIHYSPGFTAINGLFRHGFMLAPSLVNLAIDILKSHGDASKIDDPHGITLSTLNQLEIHE